MCCCIPQHPPFALPVPEEHHDRCRRIESVASKLSLIMLPCALHMTYVIFVHRRHLGAQVATFALAILRTPAVLAGATRTPSCRRTCTSSNCQEWMLPTFRKSAVAAKNLWLTNRRAASQRTILHLPHGALASIMYARADTVTKCYFRFRQNTHTHAHAHAQPLLTKTLTHSPNDTHAHARAHTKHLNTVSLCVLTCLCD